MKNLLIIAVMLTLYTGKAQSFSFHIDHYSMVVKDLDATGDFYTSILGLREIPHPTNAEGFRWFSIDNTSQLHLIRKDSVPADRSKSEHLCLSTARLDDLIEYLKEEKITFWDWEGNADAVTLRADGVRQIYLQDPEDNWIEVNDASHQG